MNGSGTGGRLAVGFFCLRPSGVPRCCQVWSVARCTFAPAGALVGIRHGVLPRLHIYAVPGAPLHHIIHVIQYHSN